MKVQDLPFVLDDRKAKKAGKTSFLSQKSFGTQDLAICQASSSDEDR